MKKSIVLTVMILLGIAYAGRSQTDTVCISIKDAKSKLVRIEQLVADSLQCDLIKEKVGEQKNIIASQEITIKDLKSQVATEKISGTNFQLQSNQNLLLAESWKQTYKKQKRKTTKVEVIGITIISGLTYLLIKK